MNVKIKAIKEALNDQLVLNDLGKNADGSLLFLWKITAI